MPSARSSLAAATGPDGRTYAIGGVDGSGTIVNTVYAYTPSSDSWVAVAPMPTTRDQLAAATGPDGRIYAIGGFDNGQTLSTVEAYDTEFVPASMVPETPLSILLVCLGVVTINITARFRDRRSTDRRLRGDRWSQ